MTLCNKVIENSEDSFKGPLSCIGSDSTWSAIETDSLWSIYCDYSRSHGNCSDCFQYAIRIALRETAYPESDAEAVEA